MITEKQSTQIFRNADFFRIISQIESSKMPDDKNLSYVQNKSSVKKMRKIQVFQA